jgi:hypothetical protein
MARVLGDRPSPGQYNIRCAYRDEHSAKAAAMAIDIRENFLTVSA